MNYVILQKVVYRSLETKRPVYAMLVGQNEEGLALVFVKRPNRAQSHSLAIAVDSGKGYFEDAATSQFPLDRAVLAAIGTRLEAIADGLEDAEINKLLEDL